MIWNHRRTQAICVFLLSLHCTIFHRGTADKSTDGLSPVILVPGDGGSQFVARWDKPEVSHIWCSQKQVEWYQLWLDTFELYPEAVECFVDNIRLTYDPYTRTTSNSPGVELKVRNFGNSTSVEYLTESPHIFSAYFADVASSIISLGYNRTTTIKGAPFDFRKAPNELEDYFLDLNSLIEDTFFENNEKVTLIAHSMGAPLLHYFLLFKTQEWKDIYIQAVISMAGAWGGAVKSIGVFAAGYDLGVSVLSGFKLRPAQRSEPSLAFLLPSRNLWDTKETLVQSPKKNYSISNYEEFFNDIGCPNGYDMYLDTRDLLYNAGPPGVEVHCLYGIGVPTTERYEYANMKNFPNYPKAITGDGDGTVNRKSSEMCQKWQGAQKQKVYTKAFSAVDHMRILYDKDAIQYIVNYLKKTQKTNLKRNRRRKDFEDNSINGWKLYDYLPHGNL